MAYQADIKLNIEGLEKLKAIETAVQNINKVANKPEPKSSKNKKALQDRVKQSLIEKRTVSEIITLERELFRLRKNSAQLESGNADKLRAAEQLIKAAKADLSSGKIGIQAARLRLQAANATVDAAKAVERSRSSRNFASQSALTQQRQKQELQELAAMTRNAVRSPVRGGENFPGSPKFIEANNQAIKRQVALLRSVRQLEAQGIKNANMRASLDKVISLQQQGKLSAQKTEASVLKDMIALEKDKLKTTQATAKFKSTQVNLEKKEISFKKQNLNTEKQTTNELKKQQKIQAQNRQKRNQRLENVALGVGFPLLFGAGPASIAGSIAGSFAGSGFGGQILGGSLGKFVDDFVVNINKLAQSLDDATSILEGMETAGIGVSKGLQKTVENLEKQGRFTDAYNVSLSALEQRLGSSGLKALQKFNFEVDELERELQSLTADLISELLPAFAELARILNILIDATKEFSQDPTLKFLLGTDGIREDGTIGGSGIKPREVTPNRSTPGEIQKKDATEAQVRNKKLLAEINRQSAQQAQRNASLARGQLDTERQQLDLARQRVNLEAQAIEQQIRLAALRRSLALGPAQSESNLQEASLNLRRTLSGAIIQNIESGKGGDLEEVLKMLQEVAQSDVLKQVQAIGEAFALAGRDFPPELQNFIQDTLTKSSESDIAQTLLDVNKGFNDRLEGLKTQTALLKAANDEERIRIRLASDLKNIESQVVQIGKDRVNQLKAARTELAEAEIAQLAVKDAVNATTQLYNEIGTTLTDSFLSGLDAVINKTGDLNAILSDTLKQIGMIFIRAGINGLAGSDGQGFFSFLTGTLGKNPPGKALGGPVDKGRPYVIGEQGPELFIPESSGQVITNQNMVSAMNRYSPGRNANAMTQVLEDMSDPNGVNSSMFGGSSNSFSNQTEFNNSRSITQGNSTTNFNNNTNSSVFNNSSSTADSSSNMTDGSIHFSMETTVINGIEYATIDQVHAMGARATKEGAKLGEARTLGRLKSSTSVRNKLGM